jgi:trans-aconitate methyltransferase
MKAADGVPSIVHRKSMEKNMHWDAQRYLQQHGFIIERGQALVDLLAPRAGEHPRSRLRYGGYCRTIAERGAKVVGVDASPEMIITARSRFPMKASGREYQSPWYFPSLSE